MERVSIHTRSTSTSNRSPNGPVATSSVQTEQGFADKALERRPPKRGNSDNIQTLSEYLSGPSSSSSGSPHGPSRSASGARRASGGETWKDFLRETGRHSGSVSRQSGMGDQLRRTKTDPLRNTNDLSRLQNEDHVTSASRKRVTSTAAEESHGKRRSYAGLNSSTASTVTGSARDSIDLTSPTNPNRPIPNVNMQRHASNGSIIIPPWQPDQEVSQCPVCRTPFSLWYRRHHCRKCGRVVCANCSPHRITIPRQFIVHPPPAAPSTPFGLFGSIVEDVQGNTAASEPQGSNGVSLSRQQSAALGGGEVVRVCNPCVPDPNFSPPPQVPVNTPAGTPSLSPFTLASGNPASGGPVGFQPRQPAVQNTHSSAPSTTSAIAPNQQPHGLPPGLALFLAANPGATAFTQRERNDPHSLHHHHARMSWLQAHHATMNPPPDGPSNSRSNRAPSQGRIPAAYRQRFDFLASLDNPSAPPAVPLPSTTLPINEEDECPVCGRELPAKGPNGDTTRRERHVEECIRLYSLPSSSIPKATTTQRSLSNSAMPPTNPVVLPGGSSALATPASPTGASTAGQVTVDLTDDTTFTPRPARLNQHRYLVYHATEKDCIGEDGERQECVICFEEFEEGDEMARLDCICKFHKACIQQWWDTKGRGSCPTHQLHQ